MPTIRDLADRTPSTRRRHVDALRAAAMLAVVLGHWLVMTVERDATGRLTGFTALQDSTALHPLTWVFQVMPVFFLVGGVSNAISWKRHRDGGGRAGRWLLDRSARLFPPVTVLLVTIAVGSILAGWAGVPTADVAQAVHLVTMPLWFLIVYLAVIALTPLAYRAHERWGLAVPLVMLAAVALGDVAHLSTGDAFWAYGNYGFAWVAVHQVGFAWEDGRLRLTRLRSLLLLGGALAALVLATVPGPYPVSMVTVPGAAIQNAGPPTLALMALAAAQVGLAGLVSPHVERALRRPGPWTAVIGVNSMMLTLYLWHMVAALGGALALDAVGLLPSADVASAAWWWGRVPWLVVLVAIQAGLVAVFGRIETRAMARRIARASGASGPSDGARGATSAGARRVGAAGRARTALAWLRRTSARTPVVAGAYVAAILGIFVLAWSGHGPHGPFMVPTSSLVLLFAGAAALRLGRAAGAARATTVASRRGSLP